jgi:hypothetical protein
MLGCARDDGKRMRMPRGDGEGGSEHTDGNGAGAPAAVADFNNSVAQVVSVFVRLYQQSK